VRCLIVGQAPSKSSEGLRPFHPSTKSGKALASLAGVRDISRRAQTINLIGRFPGKDRWRKGDKFPLGKAKRAASRLQLSGFRRVVLIGRYVAKAFGEPDRPFLRWFTLGDARAVIVPHPSGVNHWWLDRRNRRRARRVMRGLFQ
jgi:uracil-DNA glycosylase